MPRHYACQTPLTITVTMSTTGTSPSSASVRSGIAAVDRYLDAGYDDGARHVVALCRRRLRAACMRIQSEMGVTGPVVEIGTFEGRFFIALCHALAPGEMALGIDLFDWPNPQVIDRFEANCAKHGVPPERRITWKADSRTMAPRSCWPSSAASARASSTSTASIRARR